MISKFMSAVITSNALSFQCPCGGAGHIRVDIQVLFLSKALHIMYSTAQHLKLVYRFLYLLSCPSMALLVIAF